MQQSWLSLVSWLVLLGDGAVLLLLYRRGRHMPADAPRTWMWLYAIALGLLALVQLTVVLIQVRQPGVPSYERRIVAGLALLGVLAMIGVLIRVWWLRYRRRSP